MHSHEFPGGSDTFTLGNETELTLMTVPAGELEIEAVCNSDADTPEYSRRLVTFTQFLMSATPITQAQWRTVAGYAQVDIVLPREPSYFEEGDDFPVERVSWQEATEFCKRLSEQTNRFFHLPSDAQWEYACRAGTKTNYHFGSELTPELANYGADQTTAVRSYPHNQWGLYDMHGNVYEWCADSLNGHKIVKRITGYDAVSYPAFDMDIIHIARGGCWASDANSCRSQHRNFIPYAFRSRVRYRSSHIGFRVSCSI